MLAAAALGVGCTRVPTEPDAAYRQLCARCHGDDGRGSPRVVPNPKLDLTASEAVRRGDVATVRRQIADGHGAMPGFARKLTPQQVDALARYTVELAGPGMRAGPIGVTPPDP